MKGHWVEEWGAEAAPSKVDLRSVGAAIAALVLWNVLAAWLPAGQLPIGAAGVVGLVFIARRAGLGWSDLGMARRDLRRGLEVGAISACVALFAVLVAAAIPGTRSLLADGRFVGMEAPQMVYEALVRIPLAVAAAEEIAFRGVLFGLVAVRTTRLRAIWVSSALFGLWHVLPGISALETASVIGSGSSIGVAVGLVAGQVLVTGIAGGAFCWLRLRAQHVAAPILAHAVLNSASLVIGWLAVQNGWA